MGVLSSPTSPFEKQEIGPKSSLTVQGGAHVSAKPIPHGALGHYRTTHRCAIVITQAANSHLWAVRNAHVTRLIVPISIRLKWLQIGAHTAAIEDSIDIYKATSFSVVHTTNTVTPITTRYRTDFPDPTTDAVVRGITVAGIAAGMTGQTATLETNPFAQLPQWLLAALPTASTVLFQELFYEANTADGEHPFVLKQNEGIIIANRVLLGAAASSSLYIDFSFALVDAY